MEVKAVEIVSKLRRQISRLISLYQDLKFEREELIREKMGLLEQIESLNKEKEELERQYDILKLAKTFVVNTGGSEQAKNQISQIVREIDKCIALLNK